MSIYDSKRWTADLDAELDTLPMLRELEGKSVLITGAGGLICSAAADLMIRYNETHAGKVRIMAAGRSRERMEDRFAPCREKDYFRFVPYDAASAESELPEEIDFIIHGAGNASPGKIIAEPVETLLSNFNGLYRLLSYLRDRGSGRALYISSSEVYGQKKDPEPFREDEYGFIDLLNARNSYSVAKRAAETLCASFAEEYGVDSVIVRPGHIYGPTATVSDNRVSSAFAWAAARGEDIVMKSDGSQLRSYCHCLDCAGAIFTVLLRGERGRAYNISNPDSVVSIREMAELLCAAGGVRLLREEATAEEKKSFNPMDNSSLDSASLLSLGWRGVFDAPTGFAHTVEVLRQMMDK